MITTPQQLQEVVSQAREVGRVALDTEFVWERTYYAKLGVVQIGWSQEACYLIDVVALRSLDALGELLADPAVVKILHDAPQDLMILRQATGVFPKNVFDTRLAAGFAGLSSTLSLRRLLNETVGVDLAKTESRSDWLRRPLTPAQRAYALDDVRYLPDAADALLERIRAYGREGWLQDELAGLDDPALYSEKAPESIFWKIKGMSRLSPRERSILRTLAAWRETEARSRDLPRTHVVSDEALLLVAHRRPATPEDAQDLKGVPRRYADAMAAGVEEGLRRAAEEPVRLPEAPAEDDTLGARVDLLLAYLKGKGLSDGMDPALVASRAEITALAIEGAQASPEQHALLRGWRRTFIGEDLLQLLDGSLSVRLDARTGLPGRS